MKLGFIGLGKMGSRMVLKLLKEGHDIVAWNRSQKSIDGLRIAKTIEELVKSLEKPRVIWLMVPAGEATQSILDEVLKYTEAGDIVIDGGNAYYKDTERRYQEFKKKGIRFLGIGVSGGMIAAIDGYPQMVGGDKSGYEFIKPILDSLAKPARHASKALRAGPHGGHEYFGTGGAGHFVKMIHNGIEYGIMQSLGEGFGVLEKAPYDLDLLKVAKLYQKGTLLSGFMLDRVTESLENDPNLSKITGYIEESGEARWTVEQARDEGVDVEIIERSLEFRRRSQKDPEIQKSFAARMVAALRHAFGGHEAKKK